MQLNHWIKWLQDQLGPTHTWPNAIRYTLLSNRHPKNSQRFAAWCFLLGNGIKPNMISEFSLFRWEMDSEAQRQMTYVFKNAFIKPWTYWDLVMRRSLSLQRHNPDPWKPTRGKPDVFVKAPPKPPPMKSTDIVIPRR